MNKLKEKMMVALPVATVAGGTMVAFAEDGAATADSALVSGATNAVAQVTANINAVIPIALGVMGIVLAIKIGIRVFKTVTKSSAS